MAERRSTANSTPREEAANRLTHGLGLAASLVGGPLLVGRAIRSGDPLGAASVAVYVLTLMALYTASTLYHSVEKPDLKRVFRLLDHSAIFLLIAGTYTPVAVLVLRDGLGWALLGAAWLLAGVGIAWKICCLEKFPVLGPVYYLAMGWLALVAVKPLLSALSTAETAWLLAGGVAYTSGVAFYAWKKLPFNHAVWHLFVLAGSACHYVAIALNVWPGA
jgi:hemolysin III